jgi:hypothetical protein
MNTIPAPALPIMRQLLADERLLWHGQPGQGIRLQPTDALMIPFSLFWCGFAFFWEFSVLTISGINFSTMSYEDFFPVMNFFALWGIPFCVIGLYLVFGRFIFDAWQRRRTTYGVTDQRILFLKGREVTALPLTTLPACHLRVGANGRGTIGLRRNFLWTQPLSYAVTSLCCDCRCS